MPVNRYNLPAQYEYMQMPYEELARAGALKQQRFDQGLDDLSKTGGAIKINADSKSEALRNQIVKEYNDQLASVTDEYLKTGDTNVLRKAKKIQYDFASDTDRMALERSALQEKANRDYAEKQGTDYREYHDPWSKYNPSLERGQYKGFTATNFGKFQDYQAPALSLMGNIKEDLDKSYGGIKKGKDGKVTIEGDTQTYSSYEDAKKRLTTTKVKAVADKNAEDFILTNPSVLNERFGAKIEYNKLSPEGKKEAKQIASDYLQDVAYKQVYESSSYKESPHNLSDFASADIAARKLTHSPTPVTPYKMSDTPDIEFDENGKPKPKKIVGEDKQTTVGSTGAMTSGSPYQELYGNKTKKESVTNKEAEEFITNIKTRYPSLSKLDNKKAYEVYKKTKENYSQQVGFALNPSGPAKDALVEQLKEDMFSRGAVLIGGNEAIKTFEGDGGIADQLGYNLKNQEDKEDFKKAMANTIKIEPGGAFPGASVMEISDKEGNTRKIHISPDAEVQQAFGRTFSVRRKMEELLNNPTADGRVQSGSLILNIVPDISEKGNANFTIEMYDRNGNHMGDTDIETIEKNDTDNFQGSGLVGSNLTTTDKKKN